MLRWTSIIVGFMCWALGTKANVPTQCEVATLAFPESVWMMPNTARVPFQLVGRLIMVEAQVDTVRGSFVLDTGAEQLVLNARHFRPDYISEATAAAGVTGSVETVGRKKVSELELDVFRLKRLRADVIDLSHIEKKKNHRILGLLGFSVLENFELFVDFKLKQLIFTKVDKKGNWLDSLPWLDRPSDTLDFRLRRHVIEIAAEVGGEKVRFGLDTGAEINLLDRGVKQEAMQHFKILKRVLLNGTGGEATEVLAGKLYKVRCGPKYCSGMRTLVTSMDDINAVYGTRLDGLLGFEFICAHRFSINYQKEKMFFYPVFPESSP